MKMIAVDGDTGRVVMTSSGSMTEKSLRQTISQSFPSVNQEKLVVVVDGQFVPKTRGTTDSHQTSSTGVVWKGSFCFVPDSKVMTVNGVKKISDILLGDLVLTHSGRFKRVLSISKREWDGETMVVKTALDNEEILMTPFHSVIGTRGAPCSLRNSQTCKPTCKTQYSRSKYFTCEKPYIDYVTQNIKASDLTTNDFMLLPKLNNESTRSEINIVEYLDQSGKWSCNENWIWPSREHNKTNKSTISRDIVKDILVPYYDPISRVNIIPAKHKLCYDLGRFFGLYAAEGSGTYGIRFSFHENETDLHEFVENFVKTEFKVKTTKTKEKSKRAVCIYTSSTILDKIFKSCCGKCSNSKKVPDFIFSSDYQTVTGFINGLWEGDGNKNARRKDNSLKFASTSASLAYGLRLLLSRFGVSCSINTTDKKTCIFYGKEYPCSKVYELRISGEQLYTNEWLLNFKYNQKPHKHKSPRSRQYFTGKEGCFVKIISVEKKLYKGEVFDLEVEDDHSYTVNGKSVHNSDLGGYAGMNREICLRLGHHGIQVKTDVLPTGLQVDSMTHNLIRAMETVRFKGDSTCPIVVGFTPVSINAPGRRLIFYTMMETQGLHQEFVKRCNSATEIWVPCRFYEKVFREAGVIKPIHVLPLGVNHLIYTPEAEEPRLDYELVSSGKMFRTLPKDEFRFMSLFGWSYRKGPDVLCKAFLREFDSTDDVCLVIYSRYIMSSSERNKQHVRDEILGYYEEVGKSNPPPIYYCGDDIPISQLPGCYAAADAFVLCSRGEGFSLPLIEAAACGTPVIAAYNTGMTEYLDDEVAWLVHDEGFGSANEKLCWISEYYRDQQFVVLGEDSIRQCQSHMRALFSRPEEAEVKSRSFRERVLNQYTWDACVGRVAKRLKSER